MNIERTKSLIKNYEKLVLTKYRDSLGYWTIGWGHLLAENDPLEEITEDEAEVLYDRDFDKALRYCQLFVPNWNGLGDVRQAVLTSMMFQLGLGSPGRRGVLGFTNMIRALRELDFEGAADAMLSSLWHRQTRRRCEELAEMMRCGEWPAEKVNDGRQTTTIF